MTAPQCEVVGCESSAYTPYTLRTAQEWASLPAEVMVCNLHRDLLNEEDTEWLLVRDGRKLYVGDELRKLNEFVVLEPPSELQSWGAGREFSHDAGDGWHLPLKVRRRGEKPSEITLILSQENLESLRDLIKDL